MTLMSQKRKPSETYNQHKQKHEEKWHVTQENHWNETEEENMNVKKIHRKWVWSVMK